MGDRREFWPGPDDEFRVIATWDGCRDPRLAHRVVRINEADCTIRFEDGLGPTLYDGRQIEVTLHLKNARTDAIRRATVMECADVDAGRVYQLRFIQEPEDRTHLRRLLERHFNRRRAFRVTPEGAMPIKATLALAKSNWSVAAKVVDISATGIGLLANSSLEQTLGEVTAFVVRLRLPEHEMELEFDVDVIARDVQGGSVTYQLSFIDDESPGFDRSVDAIVQYTMACQRARLQSTRDH